ncbi:MAG TPA: hypothetical protein VMK13_18300 [Streptosporangiaceae bacterium]|nr:hypothetical protein [Streptosporangiaceae bacterium]
MTQQYLIGELSMRLGELQAAASQVAAREVARLRREVETRPVAGLASAAARALVLADGMCWDSLTGGDAGAFARQAEISAELRQFGICACLLDEDYVGVASSPGSGPPASGRGRR